MIEEVVYTVTEASVVERSVDVRSLGVFYRKKDAKHLLNFWLSYYEERSKDEKDIVLRGCSVNRDMCTVSAGPLSIRFRIEENVIK